MHSYTLRTLSRALVYTAESVGRGSGASYGFDRALYDGMFLVLVNPAFLEWLFNHTSFRLDTPTSLSECLT